MSKELNKKLIKIIMEVVSIVIIVFFAYSITPKTFQNDTFYTIKIGEHIQNSVTNITELLPWNKGLYSQDPFSFHENLQYTYPHWLYDFLTYKVYCISGFKSVYIATCILSIILGLSIYFVNKKFNKNIVVSAIITILSLYCLKNFIAARAQLVTFILFVFTIYGIEQFISTKKLRYAIMLIVIPIIIANVHSAVWPFYFVLYLPYLAEFLVSKIITTNYPILIKKIMLKIKMKKLGQIQYDMQKSEIEKLEKKYNQKIEKRLKKSYKLNIKVEKNVKWLVLIAVICLFTGVLTPIKDMPYTYIIRTNAGNTIEHISEHVPLTLIKNFNMILILVLIIGILTFTRTKIKLRDFFMLSGLILLSFMTQRQVSMLVLIGNFIVAYMICDVIASINKKELKKFNTVYFELIIMVITTLVTMFCTINNYKKKIDDEYIDSSSYPVAAANYIQKDLVSVWGKQNLRIFNDYNYGSYLLFENIPVFIDSRCDLYTPEFNGEKDENGVYQGRDIFTDFINVSGLATDYEVAFEKYKITHVITYSNSKLNSLISKDSKYELMYEDNYFVVYARK